jgi:demethylmenaquinone methyltransferase / 2-methoxy-6-polyprenyl-1,4-benzoquinol methylase
VVHAARWDRTMTRSRTDIPPGPHEGRDCLLSADENRRMFDRIARRYDLLNAVMSLGLNRRWRRRTVAELAPRPGGRYLDVGCGTGDLGIELVRQCGGAHVVGIDPAGGMLAVGAARLRRAGLSRAVELRLGDAMAMDLPDAAFDGVMSAYVIRNLPNRLAALAEIRRVLVAGGRVVALELTAPTRAAQRMVCAAYRRCFIPLAGRLIAGEAAAYRYLADSVAAFPPAGQIVAAMTHAGLADARYTSLNGGIVTLFTARRE